MTVASIIEKLGKLRRAKPFVPFKITATTGEQYQVRDPFSFAIGNSELLYFFPKADKSVRVRIQEIISIETLQAA
jgi:hypothetical protein